MELVIVNSSIIGLIVLIYVTTVFIIAQLKRDNSIIDIAYGPAFLFGVGGTILLTKNISPTTLIVAILIAVWATRLSLRIYSKNRNQPEDTRYANWRKLWMKQGRLYFILRSYLQIFLLQGLIIILVATPASIILTHPSLFSSTFVIIGCAVFLFGLIYETIADWQIDHFIKRKKVGASGADLLTTGLFQYSRRPNYFGETLIWWGLAIIALPLPFGWLGLISPLLITFIVTKITGPMLENIFLKKYPTKYALYQQTTPYFIPWPKQTKSRICTTIVIGIMVGLAIAAPLIPSHQTNRTETIFVYGTLTNPYIRALYCQCRTTAIPATLKNYEKVGLNVVPKQNSKVDGYIITVDESELRSLDAYEQVPFKYDRQLINIGHDQHWMYTRINNNNTFTL